jgi:hypothetical protein
LRRRIQAGIFPAFFFRRRSFRLNAPAIVIAAPLRAAYPAVIGEESMMRKCILISACLAMMLGLCGCLNPNTTYRVYFQDGPVDLASPYDDPSMYRGSVDGM